MYAALSVGDVATLAGALAALIAAIGGVGAAGIGIREYTLKTAAQRVEIDVNLSRLLAELVPVANGRGPATVSDAVAEAIVKSRMSEGASLEEIAMALKSAVEMLEQH